MHVTKTITIKRPVDEVYAFWRDFENLPRFMYHLEIVESTGSNRSHWVAKAPAGKSVEWDAEIAEDRPGELIAWRSVGTDDDVHNSGTVRFTRAPGDRGTEVRVDLQYEAPGGKAGSLVAKLFGEEPSIQIGDDLHRLKQVMETGEVLRSHGAPEGIGRNILRQHASQPAEPEARP